MIKMPTLTEKVRWFAEERNLEGVVVASGEGLPLASNLEEVEREAALGVQEIKNRLLEGETDYFIRAGEGKSKILCQKEGLYYILYSRNEPDEKDVHELHQLVAEDLRARRNPK
ncbi:MAG: hypothetical protein B6U72_03125 [Candidatus Altiarchaeales archaeon ex4484_2]|nr:MAG: hypothetical protein B6U72_03125 [Candidatus Altiarchaeales archaeon ex4484_2]